MSLSRSEHMARVKGKNTSPERLLRSALWEAGLRYRLNYKVPMGRPDIVFPGPKVAVTVWFFDLEPSETLPRHGAFTHPRNFHGERPSRAWSDALRLRVFIVRARSV